MLLSRSGPSPQGLRRCRAPAPTATSPRARWRRPWQHVSQSHGQLCSCTHRNTSRHLPAAARNTSPHPTDSRAPAPTAPPPTVSVLSGELITVPLSHGQSCSCAHLNAAKCPPTATWSHVFHGQPCSRAHCITSCHLKATVFTSFRAPQAAVLPRPL
jgi:hypothetical protein